MVKQLTAGLILHFPTLFETKENVGFMTTIKQDYDTKEVYKNVSVWLFQFFLNQSEYSMHNVQNSGKHPKNRKSHSETDKTGILPTHNQMVHSLLDKCGSDKEIVRTKFGTFDVVQLLIIKTPSIW